MPAPKYSFFYRNGLSIVVITFMLIFWAGQFITGRIDNNEERKEHNRQPLTIGQYITSGHFVSATFENWESEFLQMGIYVLLTVWLRQKGSAESKKLKGEEGAGDEPADRKPKKGPDAPWPVNKGGLWLKIYSHSLTIAFVILFLLSFSLHFAGSLKEYNDQQNVKNLPETSASEYITNAHFWFESFQNWQSEFLAVGSIVLLSIWLRQKGSPESKPVDAPYEETGG